MIRPKFLSPLDLRKQPDGTWVLLNELRYDSAILRARLIIPQGFVTDLASVPRLPFAFWLAGDAAHAAAVVHDFLYRHHLVHRHAEDRRAIADAVFLEAMTCEGVPAWRRWLMHASVRCFGDPAWRKVPPA